MSFVVAVPDLLGTAATDLANIGSTLGQANAAAAAQTTGVLAAAQDEVSAAIAALFSAHGQSYQALSTQAATFHQQFAQALSAGAGAYAGAEAANTSPIAQLLLAINAPVQALTGRPLVGNGGSGGAAGLLGTGGAGGAGGGIGTIATATAGAGGIGGAGGFLWGNGGAGG